MLQELHNVLENLNSVFHSEPILLLKYVLNGLRSTSLESSIYIYNSHDLTKKISTGEHNSRKLPDQKPKGVFSIIHRLTALP